MGEPALLGLQGEVRGGPAGVLQGNGGGTPSAQGRVEGPTAQLQWIVRKRLAGLGLGDGWRMAEWLANNIRLFRRRK